MEIKELSYRTWASASAEQRQTWLEDDYCFDFHSQKIVNWAEIFRSAGCSISESHILFVYDNTVI